MIINPTAPGFRKVSATKFSRYSKGKKVFECLDNGTEIKYFYSRSGKLLRMISTDAMGHKTLVIYVYNEKYLEVQTIGQFSYKEEKFEIIPGIGKTLTSVKLYNTIGVSTYINYGTIYSTWSVSKTKDGYVENLETTKVCYTKWLNSDGRLEKINKKNTTYRVLMINYEYNEENRVSKISTNNHIVDYFYLPDGDLAMRRHTITMRNTKFVVDEITDKSAHLYGDEWVPTHVGQILGIPGIEDYIDVIPVSAIRIEDFFLFCKDNFKVVHKQIV